MITKKTKFKKRGSSLLTYLVEQFFFCFWFIVVFLYRQMIYGVVEFQFWPRFGAHLRTITHGNRMDSFFHPLLTG